MKIAYLSTAIGDSNIGDQILFRESKRLLNTKYKEDQTLTFSLKDFLINKNVPIADMYIIVGAAKVKTNNQDWKDVPNAYGKLVLYGVGSDGGNKFDQAQEEWFKKHLNFNIKQEVRDDETAELLKSIGIKNVENISCPSITGFSSSLLKSWNGKDIILASSTPLEGIDFIKKQFKELSASYNVTLFAQSDEDYEVMKQVSNNLIKPNIVEYEEFLNKNRSSLFIGSRFHGAVDALIHKSAAIIISNGYKNRAILKYKSLIVEDFKSDISYLDIINSLIDYKTILRKNIFNKRNAKIYVRELADDNSAEYQLIQAYSNDVLGNERIAQKHYESAFNIGLPLEEELNWFRYYGSTLRWNKEYEKSIEVLTNGLKKYDDNVSRGFKAMSEYSLNLITLEELKAIIKMEIPEKEQWALEAVRK